MSLRYFDACKDIRSLDERSRTLGVASASLLRTRNVQFQGLANDLANLAQKAMEAISDDWLKIDVGYRLAEIFSSTNRTLSIELVQKANATRESLRIHEDRDTYLSALRLVTRAYAALASADAAGSHDLLAVGDRIRIYHQQELALRYGLIWQVACSQKEKMTRAKIL